MRDEDVLTVRYALLVIAEPERKAQPLAVRRCLVELLGAWAADGSGDVAIGAGEDDGGSAARKKHMQGLVTWLQTAACQRALKTFITDNGILKTCEAYFTSEHEALDFQVDVVKDIMSSRASNDTKSTNNPISKALKGVGVEWVQQVDHTYDVTKMRVKSGRRSPSEPVFTNMGT